MLLTTSKICPFAHRVWLTLLESGLPFTLDEVSIKAGEKPAHFTALYKRAMGADSSSDGKVPVLTDGDLVLTESAHVADYVASKAQAVGKDLLPATPLERIRSGLFTEQATGAFVKSFYAPMFAKTQADLDKAKAALTDAAALVSTHLAASSGPYVLGDRATLADFLLWPFVARLCVLETYRGFVIPNEPRTAAFHAWCTAMAARPAVIATHQPNELFIDGYKGYVQAVSA